MKQFIAFCCELQEVPHDKGASHLINVLGYDHKTSSQTLGGVVCESPVR
jgi:hypothetical protein